MIELKKLIDIFNYASEEDKKKYYDMICDLAEKFDKDFFSPYISSYKSPDSLMPIVGYLDKNIQLIIFFSFYKGFKDSTIDVKLYFKDMLNSITNYVHTHHIYEVLPSIYGFLLDTGNDRKNRFAKFSNPIEKPFGFYIDIDTSIPGFSYQTKFMENYLNLIKSIVSIDSSINNNIKKILLSPDDMENIYIDILQYCKLNTYSKDIDALYFQFMDTIKTFGLRNILEDMLNRRSSIISTIDKMGIGCLVEKLTNLIFGCRKTKCDKYLVECALLDIMRKVQNKYIYNNELLSIRKICLKHIASSSDVSYMCYRYLTGNESDGNFLYAMKVIYEESDHNEEISDIMKECFVEI